jgi:3-phosphoglycerate kinase
MEIKKIQNINVRGKKIIVRVDFNVSKDKNDHVKSTYKIAAAKNTIDMLIEKGASHIGLLTHFGRPDGKVDEQYSLRHIKDDIAKTLERDIVFVSDCVGDKVSNELGGFANGKVILLENVRFYEEEKKDTKSFAAELCTSFDIYVNDAFAVCHREHASVHAITKCIPSFAGLWVQKELKNLKKIKHHPIHPAVAIIGGAKIDTKVPMIEEFSDKYETVLVGGKTAVEAKERGMKFRDSVVFPIDFEYKYYDIGPKTIENFCEYIKTAKMIVWNGPMGVIEKEKYKKGTIKLIEQIAQNEDAFSLIGGGESAQMVEESGCIDKISFLSTGGGAMLTYLGGEEMPGIDVLLCSRGKCV